MGQRGPRPTPAHLRMLRGDREDRVNRDEPQPAEAEARGVELTEGAALVWDRLAPDLVDKGVLTAWDADLFSVFCEAVAAFHECKRLMGREFTGRGAAGGVVKSPYWQIMRDCEQVMSRIGGRFGLSPGDRAALKVSSGEAPSSGASRLLG